VVHLARGGQSWRLENTLHAPPEKKGAAVGDGRLASPMNGRVVAVNARPGERIEPGAALVVLEAMKMEHGLALPAPVRVTAVHVAAGAQVAPGRLLVEFEPA
jgi:acetyl/propionyl-CoA carboxylase alpha subunit